ncbi:MFS transporter [Actinoplanes bogorensis]|uniref:MFS transporter n=1 Tax=Paractinoplanes bogorensis TaxID=1610840 RepID=A0ABS5YLF8_9ACTN|nr:MFS transporter [Actinoplanes bogorensis]MBU2664156.1 MFS transporter [Actinoplanes bogorensis]
METRHRRVCWALFAAGVATFAALYSTQALLPLLATEFGVTPGQSSWSLSMATIGLGATLLVTGPLSERFGRTRLIHLSVTLSALIGLACAIAPGWHALLVLRLLQGIALAGLPAVATAYLREELPASITGRVTGLYIGGNALGGMAGRLLTGAVSEAYGWRVALAAVGLLGLVCALVVAVLLPRSRNFTPRPASFGSLKALKDPALLSLYGIGACAMGAFVAVSNAMGFRLTTEFGLGVGAAGAVFLVYPVGSVSSTLSGRLADRFGRRAVMPFGCLVTAAGLLMTLAGYLPVVVAGLAVMTAGFFCVHGVASGWVPVRAHAGDVPPAQAASFYLFAYYAGSSIFGSLAGTAWSLGAWPAVVALASVFVGLTGVLSVRLRAVPALVISGR